MSVALEPPTARDARLPVAATALALTIAAWTVLGLAGHQTPHASFLAAFAMWNVMMVAMMLPSALPWLAILSTGKPGSARLDVTLFAIGYFAVWALYCLAAAAVQIALQERMWLSSSLALTAWPGALVLIGAGLFQFSPLKAACLRHCRSPLGYLLTHWRERPGWTLRVGATHGVYCVGCCWALMAVVFAVGVMNLGWMAVLTLVVCLEQWLPRGAKMSYASGAGLVGWGLARLTIG